MRANHTQSGEHCNPLLGISPDDKNWWNAGMSASEMSRHRIARLRELLALRQWSQAALARHAGTHPSYISDLLNGRKPLGEKAARSIEKTIGLSPNWLDLPPETTPAVVRGSPPDSNIPHGGRRARAAVFSESREMAGVELTKDAVEVAEAWMMLHHTQQAQIRALIEEMVGQDFVGGSGGLTHVKARKDRPSRKH